MRQQSDDLVAELAQTVRSCLLVVGWISPETDATMLGLVAALKGGFYASIVCSEGLEVSYAVRDKGD